MAKSLTGEDALGRANAYLENTIALVRSYSSMRERERSSELDESAAWSATYKPLTQLLGKELTSLWRRGGRPVERWRFVGEVEPARTWSNVEESDRWAGNGDGDHVIPLVAVIKAILSRQLTAPDELEAFLRRTLVMAEIPRNLNRRLDQSEMPDDGWLRAVPQGTERSERERAVWARYVAAGYGPPSVEHPDWELVTAAWQSQQ